LQAPPGAEPSKLRQEQDRELIARMTVEIGKLFTRHPPREAAAIAHGHPDAWVELWRDEIWMRVRLQRGNAAVRHRQTEYDARGRHGSPSRQAADRRSNAGDLAAWRVHQG